MEIQKTLKTLETCLDAGLNLKEALKISHERAFEIMEEEKRIVVVVVLIHGHKEAYLGTMNEGEMVRTPFWNRHLSKLHESVSLVPGWELFQVFDQKTLATLWERKETKC